MAAVVYGIVISAPFMIMAAFLNPIVSFFSGLELPFRKATEDEKQTALLGGNEP